MRENRLLILILVSLLILLALASTSYLIFGHRLVTAMYRGESVAFLNRVISGQSATPLSEYFERADSFFLLFISYVLIFSTALAVMLIKHNLSFGNKTYFIIVSIAVLSTTLAMKPKLLGDGPEYYLMTESLYNHLGPDLREEDIESVRRIESRFSFPIFYRNPYEYYFKAGNGNLYSYHFWVYPLANVPVKFLLRVFRMNEAKVFQITNAILLILALYSITFISGFTESQKRIFNLLTVFSPAFWFISWTHPEIFSYAFVIMALVYMHKQKWPAAIVCASVASLQNQPLLFLAAFIWLRAFISSESKLKDFFILSLAASIGLLPNLFFYVNYHALTLLGQKAASLSNASLFKVSEMFFDLNMGMLPYVPIALLLFLGVAAKDLLQTRRSALGFQLLVLMVLMMYSCTTTSFWNHGTSGPFRYVIWMLPLVFYALVERLDGRGGNRVKHSAYSLALFAAIITQAFIVIRGGGFTPPLTQVRNTTAARLVLNHCPTLYNPSPEIFAARTTSRTDTVLTPAIYYYKGKCRKVLASGKDAKTLRELCGDIPSSKKDFFMREENRDRYIYINY